jgi:hypothetical protein
LTAALEQFIGRTLDNLTFKEQGELRGKWVAVEIYTPRTLPFRTFEAVGETAAECRAVLRQRGLDPLQFEYLRVN